MAITGAILLELIDAIPSYRQDFVVMLHGYEYQISVKRILLELKEMREAYDRCARLRKINLSEISRLKKTKLLDS